MSVGCHDDEEEQEDWFSAYAGERADEVVSRTSPEDGESIKESTTTTSSDANKTQVCIYFVVLMVLLASFNFHM